MTEAKTVADIMTRRVIFLREEDNLSRIVEGMEHFGLRHLPVLDGDKLVGMITHRDMLKILSASERREETTFVASIMTRDPIAVGPDTTIAEAARILIKARFGCLPVVDENRNVIGIVTEHDFMKILAGEE
jgi:CBS domain-containing membrane protein